MSRVTKKQRAEIKELHKISDSDIDFSDIPEVLDWSGATVGKFYRPIKKQLTIRLDADVVAWLKEQGKGYQTRINNILRSVMNKTVAR